MKIFDLKEDVTIIEAEFYHSNIEKEIWQLFGQQIRLLDRKFLLKCDHRTIIFIFHLKNELQKAIPKILG